MRDETSVSASLSTIEISCAYWMVKLTVLFNLHTAPIKLYYCVHIFWFWFLFQDFSCYYTNFLVENYHYHNPHVCVCAALTKLLFGGIAITSAPSYIRYIAQIKCVHLNLDRALLSALFNSIRFGSVPFCLNALCTFITLLDGIKRDCMHINTTLCAATW